MNTPPHLVDARTRDSSELYDYRSPFVEDDPHGSNLAHMFEKYSQAALNNKWLVIGIVALALAIGFVATLLQTPQYRASTRIEISRVDSNVTNVEGIEVDDIGRDNQYYETQYELLKASSLAERVARELNVARDPQFLAAFSLDDRAEPLSSEGAAGILLSAISISPVVSSSLVDIRATTPDAGLSARISDAWADQYIEANMDRRFGASAEAREFLEQRLSELRSQLEESEREAIDYASDRNLFTLGGTPTSGDESAGSDTTAAQTIVASDLQALNQVLGEATAARIAAESRLSAAGRGGVIDEATRTAVAGLRQRRAELESERAQLLERYGERYVGVREINAAINELDESISSELGRSGSELRAQYRQALAQEQRLRLKQLNLQSRCRS